MDSLRISAYTFSGRYGILEPTGHYWFCLATWMVTNGISVVQVHPYAVRQTKEVEDNSQLKDDRKNPKLIANLVKLIVYCG
ncbi:transposase [Hungatella sp.]|uniref:IS110 family transposase n=1 Tax=Hungatella sp. TaxID=2613924 RepID=UPI002588AD61|nr:transposase [Hungatella sp.]MCI6453491.1 IS110 family transposase [Hungatella sp.]